MRKLFLKNFPALVNNERGVAALVSIIMAIIILGSVAFNFIAETRQKQSGSAMTYTSTNALMIAEAGLRYTQKCLIDTETAPPPLWGCPTSPAIHDVANWDDITKGSGVAFSKTFGGDGSFDISFPVTTGNDENNIFVEATGNFRGAKRSFSRFVSRQCVTPELPTTEAAQFCTSIDTQNNADLDPPLPDPPVASECPADGMVNLPPLDGNYASDCICSPAYPCPDFDYDTHAPAPDRILDPAFTVFCNFILDGSQEVKTNEADHTAITVIKDFEIQDNAELRLNDDASDPLDTDQNTVILVHGQTTLDNNGVIRVNGTLALLIAGTVDTNGDLIAGTGTFEMENNTKFNVMQGVADNALAWVEGDVDLGNNVNFVGWLVSDGALTLENNSAVEGSVSGDQVDLSNNSGITFPSSGTPGGSAFTSAASVTSQCNSTEAPPNWSE